jgi:hypothetical protein
MRYKFVFQRQIFDSSGNADLWAHFVKAFVEINWIFSATLAVLGPDHSVLSRDWKVLFLSWNIRI